MPERVSLGKEFVVRSPDYPTELGLEDFLSRFTDIRLPFTIYHAPPGRTLRRLYYEIHSKELQAALDQKTPLLLREPDIYLFGKQLWKISKDEMAHNKQDLRLLFLEEVDKQREQFERLRRKFESGAETKTERAPLHVPDAPKHRETFKNDQDLVYYFGVIDSLVRTADDAGYYSNEDEPTAEIGNYLKALMCFLIASDGNVRPAEVTLFNEFFGSSDNLQQVTEWVKENYAAAVRILSSVPTFMRVLAKHDRENGTQHCDFILKCLFACVQKVVSCDGEVSKIETDEGLKIMTSLTNYLASVGIQWSLAFEESPQPTQAAEPMQALDESTSLEAMLKELNSLTGLRQVKDEVTGLVNLIKVRQMRKARGIKSPPLSLHLVFSGNPGTGKTTVARLLGRIFQALGLLSKGHLVEVDRAGLVAGYVGQTALKVKEVLERSMGGVLFIDEAYALATGRDEDFGKEAVDTLLKAMEDHRDDFAVIVAGYSDRMQSFLDMNPGLRSRFNKFIHFADYSARELCEIFDGICRFSGYTYTPAFAEKIHELLALKHKLREKDFANARTARNIFEQLVTAHSNRVAGYGNPTQEQLITFHVDDLRGLIAK